MDKARNTSYETGRKEEISVMKQRNLNVEFILPADITRAPIMKCE